MRIDIDGLTEAELIDLNHRIVERLKFLSHTCEHTPKCWISGLEILFRQPEGQPAQVGMLTRYNKKTVTVITEGGEHWNVAPGLLRRINNSQTVDNPSANVIQLHRK
jgi:hypothetical protein